MAENDESGSEGGSAANDSWGRAVSLLTGYPMPDRAGLFEELTSQHGIPLFDIVGIDHWRMQPTSQDAWGWQTHGFDFVMPFYETRGGNGAHKGVRMRGVNIRFIGTNGRPLLGPGGTMSEGASAAENSTGTWDRGKLAAYITGPTVALDALLRPPSYTTRRVAFSGLSVPDSAHVSLDSFQRTGMAFDRASLFFQGRAEVLLSWEKSFGDEESPFRGEAAGAFWDLIHIIRQNYDGYVDQMGGRDFTSGRAYMNGQTPQSQIGDSLAWAQEALRHGAASLRAAWDHWAADGWHDPYRWVLAEIEDLVRWTVANNHSQIVQQRGNLIADNFDPDFTTLPPFRQDHDWGPLAYPSTWVQVGRAAIAKWNQHVDTTIGLVAEQVTSNLSNNWRQALETVGERVRKVTTDTPSQIQNGTGDTDLPDLAELFGIDNLPPLDGLPGGGGDGSLLNGDPGLGNLPGLDGLPGGGGGGGGGSLLNGDPGLGNLPGADGLPGGGGGGSLLNGDPGLGNLPGADGLPGGGGGGSLLNGDPGLGNLPGADGLPGGGGGGSLLNGDPGLGNLPGAGGLPGGGGGGSLLNGDPGLGDLPGAGGLPGAGDLPGGGSSVPGGIGGDLPPALLNPGIPSFSAPGSSGGGGAILPRPQTRLNSDGTLTTTYGNGNSVTLNPGQGTAVTTRPDGSTVTTDLGNGPVYNPDGSVTVANPDGSITTTHQDGTVSVLNPDGTLTDLSPDGTLTNTYTDGSTVEIHPDSGLATATAADGTTTTTDLNNGPLGAPDGSTIALNPDTGALTTTHPDGSTVTLDPATGNLVTHHADGTVTTLNPDTHTLTTTNPDGTTETTDLNGTLPNTGSDGPDSLFPGGDLNLPNDLNTEVPTFDGSGLDTGSSGGGSLLNNGFDTVGSSGPGGPEESAYFDDSQDSAAGRGIGSPVQAAATGLGGGTLLNPDAGGAPMSPGMMGPGMMGPGMMGSGAGGAGGGKEGGSERRREVYAGPQGTSGITPKHNGRAAALDDEDVVITRGRTSTSSGSYGGGAGSAQRRTESADRTRDSWKPEDEDVWGTDEGGAPAVIGR
ncbi:AAWKG family protein [Streptomyces sp. HC307]|uniref:AAWKG family protein n=1 Tax=Streptomyces flavusporus TaxID=3385496 RepID=UPI003916DD5D